MLLYQTLLKDFNLFFCQAERSPPISTIIARSRVIQVHFDSAQCDSITSIWYIKATSLNLRRFLKVFKLAFLTYLQSSTRLNSFRA